MQGGAGLDAEIGGQPPRRPQHQIVVVEPGQRGRFRAADGQRQFGGRARGHRVADIGKGDEAIE